MSSVPDNLLYTRNHEWVLLDSSTSTIGITDYAQNSLGDITFIELPEPGTVFDQGDVFGVVESVKAASDLYMPISGEVLKVNSDLEAAPERVNQSPYAEGWLIQVKPSETTQDQEGLVSAEDYQALI